MQVILVDPTDDTMFASWYRVYAAGVTHDRVDVPLYSMDEFRLMLSEDPKTRPWGREVAAAVRDDEVVGGSFIDWPERDNLNHGEFLLAVPAPLRGQGIGAALYDHAIARLAERGRTTLATSVDQPIDGPEQPAVGFLTRRGFSRVNIEMRRTLDLPLLDGRLDELHEKAARASSEYRSLTWVGHCPDEYAEQYTRLKSLLSSQAPLGQSGYQQEVWDLDRLRGEEKLLDQQGRTPITTVAIAPDGSLAGHTQLMIPKDDDGRVFQWDTLILPEHRGHRLGLLLKVINLRRLIEEDPSRTRVQTWNAVQNGPMNSVNNELGFRSVEESQEWERHLVTT